MQGIENVNGRYIPIILIPWSQVNLRILF
jgi:hypothetical protein